MIEVTAAIIKDKNKTLIARRSSEKHLGGYWEFPGGKIELGETPRQSLIREINEELGIQIRVINFFMETTYHYPNKTILLKAYICNIDSGTIKLNAHDKIEWVKINEFKNFKFAPADISFVNAIINSKLT